MSNLRSLSVTHLRIPTLLQLVSDTTTAVTNILTVPADLAQVQPEMTNAATARAPMDAEYLSPNGSMNTPVLQALDLRRDTANSCISGVVRGFSLSIVPARKAAAQRILHYFDAYENINGMVYQDETTAISSLMQDLNTTLAPDVTTLGIGLEVAELRNANNDFNTAYAARNAENPNAGNTPTLTQMRPAAEAAYKALVERVEALYISSRRAQVWATLLGNINNIRDRYNALLARQAGGGTTPTP